MHTSDLLNSESSQGQIDQHKNFGERPRLQAAETFLMSECNISLLLNYFKQVTKLKFLEVWSLPWNYTNITCLVFIKGIMKWEY